MMYCLFIYSEWIMTWVPFLPWTPIKLLIGMWILVPSYQGEVIVYQIVCESILQIEKYLFSYFQGFMSKATVTVLSALLVFTKHHRTHLAEESLPEIIKISEQLNEIFE